jgi:competence protein ComEC
VKKNIINVEKTFSSAFPFLFDYQKYLVRSEIYIVLDISYFECIDLNPNIINKISFCTPEGCNKKIGTILKGLIPMFYGKIIRIVCFYRNVLGLFRNVKVKILRFFCRVLSVAISSQLIPIPVCMYYFGKISIFQ